jgi:heterodisulfide reductase subunit B
VKIGYYPGCALHGTAWEYDQSIRKACEVLGVELEEIKDWNCCGASSAHILNKTLSVLLPARNLALAEKEGLDLLVPCAACFNRLKAAQKTVREENSYQEAVPIRGDTKIIHINEFFCEKEMLLRIRDRVKKSLTGLNPVTYYGCLTARHPRVTGMANYEDPQGMDCVLETLSVKTRPWSYKTDCCGGNLMMTRVDIVKKLSGNLFSEAAEAGADCIVTDCPLCQANLDTREHEIAREAGRTFDLPVFYISELIGLALGIDAGQWWKRHIVDPRGLLAKKGLM